MIEIMPSLCSKCRREKELLQDLSFCNSSKIIEKHSFVC